MENAESRSAEPATGGAISRPDDQANNTPEPASAGRWPGWATGALAVSAASALSYFCAYAYEVGYTSFFEIPKEFIVVDVGSVLALLWVLGGILFLAMQGMNAFNLLHFLGVPHQNPQIFRSIQRVLPPVVIMLGLMGLGWNLQWIRWTFLSVIAITLWLEFGFPLITQRKTKGYSAKLDAQEDTESHFVLPTDQTVNRLGRTRLTLAIVAIALPGGAYLKGGSDAAGQRNFTIPASLPGNVVLRKYGDYLICAPYDSSMRQVDRAFSILKLSADAPLTLRTARLGPLKVRPLSVPKHMRQGAAADSIPPRKGMLPSPADSAKGPI